jgi:hypothetical protein
MFVDGEPKFPTVERPWKNNEPNVSCIPAGYYPVKWVITQTAGNMNGYGIGLEGVPDRSLIRIHAGNTADDLRGCIAPGMQFHEFGINRGVSQSRAALHELMRLMKQTEGTLQIDNP